MVQNDRLDMRLNLARPRATGASRRSALRAPSALRAAARRSFVTNMKIEPNYCPVLHVVATTSPVLHVVATTSSSSSAPGHS